MDEKPELITFGPQDGPQRKFINTPADIAIYGGAAGGGKSWAIEYCPLRHINNPKFKGIIFRRTLPEVTNPGSLWDEAHGLYLPCGGKPNNKELKWKFPSGFSIKFAGLEHEKSKYSYQGSQIPYIGFDELTHFTEGQFWYMQSRNRSDSGEAGYVRASTNPARNSWVRVLIDWWIKGIDYPEAERGYPIPERAGKLRWFVRKENKMIWGNSANDIYRQVGKGTKLKPVIPQSLTFIPALLTDNKILMKRDPGYIGKLLSMGNVEMEQLLKGNWDVVPEAGDIFDKNDFEIIDTLPHGWVDSVRFWDKAGTKPSTANPDPDWTRGVRMVKYPNGLYVIVDMRSLRDEPGAVNTLVKNTASQDGYLCRVKEQQDPGQAGKEEAENFTKMLTGYIVKTQAFSKNKLLRCAGVRAQVKARNVKILRATKNEADGTNWNTVLLDELHNYKGEPDERDDIVDCVSGAFNELAGVVAVTKEMVARMKQTLGG